MRSTFLCCAALLLTACGLAMSNEDRLDRAEEALSAGDYRAAIIDAKDVLRDEPDNARGRLVLGRASVAVGDGAAAEKELRRAIELGVAREDLVVALARGLLQQRKFQDVIDEIQPGSAGTEEDQHRVRLVRADAYLALGQSVTARALYNEVLNALPDKVGAYRGVASSFRAEGNLAEARKTLDDITSTFPGEISGWIESGDLGLAMRDFEGAKADFETALGLAGADENIGSEVQALAGMAESQFSLDQMDDARATVDRLARLAPESPQALLLTSRVAYLDSDWTTAQQNLQKLLQRAPEYRPAQTLLGAVHLQNGNLSQAEMYLSAVVAAVPEHSQARRLLAETKLQMSDIAAAEATLAPLVSSRDPNPVDLAMAARASLSQGDMGAAIDLLQRGVEEDPTNTDLKFQLAIALMNSGRNAEFSEVLKSIDISASRQDEFRRDMLGAMSVAKAGALDEALLAAQQLVEDWPKNPSAYSFLGSVQAAREDLGGARKSFSKSIELQPGDLTALRSLAAIDEKQGDVAGAKRHYEAILEAQPNTTWAMFGLARHAARENNLTESKDWLQKIRLIDEAAVPPRVSLAAILMAEGEFDDAEQVIEEALGVGGEVAELHNLLGRAREGQGDHAGASMAFTDALQLAPGNDQYRLNLANAQRQTGNINLAERTLLSDGSVNLEHMPTAVTAASLQVESGDLAGAMQIARALQDRHPESPIPLALEAEIHVRSGRLEDANTAYDRALAIDVMRNHALRAHRLRKELGRADRDQPLQAYLASKPRDSGVRMVLAESLQTSNRIDAAVAEFEIILEQDPDNWVALNNLAWTYYLADDQRAVDTARNAFLLRSDSGAVADTLGWILVESDELDEGVELLRRAVEMTDGRAEVRYHHAAGLAKLGRADEARDILQILLASGEEFSNREAAAQLLEGL